MSLINEALKRVQQSQATRRPNTVADLRQLQPVEHTGFRTRTGHMLAVAGLMLVIGGGMFVLTVLMGRARTSSGVTAPAQPANAQVVQIPQEAASLTQNQKLGANTVPAAPGRATTGQTAAQAVQTGTAGLAQAASAPDLAGSELKPETSQPELRLQGLVYLRDGAAAVINGKTVRVGGKIGGWTVKAITRDGVNLEGDGQTRFLTLE